MYKLVLRRVAGKGPPPCHSPFLQIHANNTVKVGDVTDDIACPMDSHHMCP